MHTTTRRLALTCLSALLLLTAGLSAAAAPAERALFDEPVRVACVGDSITEGTANPDHAENSWPQILGRLLEAEFPGGYVVGNFGRSGATALQAGSRPYWNEDVFAGGLDFAPSVVILNLGTNDAAPRNWTDHGQHFERDLTLLVETYRDLDLQPRILLTHLTPFHAPHPEAEARVPLRAEVEATLAKLAELYGLELVDLGAGLVGHPELLPDGVHPNTAGNEVLARAAFTALTGKPAPEDASIRPRPLGAELPFWLDILANEDLAPGDWSLEAGVARGTGKGKALRSTWGIGQGDFHLRARLRMLNQQGSAAGFAIGRDFFGFEGAADTLFRNGPNMRGLRLLHPGGLLWERDAWIDFEVIRRGGMCWFLVDGFVCEMARIEGPIEHLAFEPMRSTMELSSWQLAGDLVDAPPLPDRGPPAPLGYTIPLVDLDADEGRHVVVDREAGQYLGHVTTSLLPDGKTILAVYPKGHGRGPIVYKRSPDGGRTWSERLPTPGSWATSQEVPTIHRLTDPMDGTERLIVWSGLYPAKRAVSEDDGATWGELEPVGDWGGIVVMGFTEQLKDGSYLAMFHDDGRFFREGGSTASPVVFTLYQTLSHDGGLTWSEPTTVWTGSDIHLCEPGFVRSPDGGTIAVLLRENSRTRNSYVIFSTDEAKTWSEPRELPAALTGDRHTAKYAPDGRLFISFRDTTHLSATQGDWVGWVGTFDDIVEGREGQYRVRLKDNKHRWDTTYPGVEVLADGTFVVTTYGHWDEGEEPFILSARFTLEELDARAAALPSKQLLFGRGDLGVDTYRIPALVTTNAGTLIAACDARHNSGADLPADIDTVVRRSTDGGLTWSPVQTVVDLWSPGEDEQPAEGTADPCLLVDRDTGRIWCAITWSAGKGWYDSAPGFGEDSFHDLLVWSDDDGLTWSAPRDITLQLKDPTWRSAWFSPGAGLQTSSGRLVLPYSVADADKTMLSYAAVSDDHGMTWSRVGPIGAKTNEHMIVELEDGTLVCNLRSLHGLGQRAIATSTDDGDTWSELTHDPVLVEPVCQASLVTLPASATPDGKPWLVFCNPASTGREHLTVRVSKDGGQTWPHAQRIHHGPTAYSCLTHIPSSNALGLLYEHGDRSPYESITFATIPLALFAD